MPGWSSIKHVGYYPNQEFYSWGHQDSFSTWILVTGAHWPAWEVTRTATKGNDHAGNDPHVKNAVRYIILKNLSH